MAAAYPWTVEWLKQVYLFGVDLTDDQNNPYPATLFEQGMAAAIGTLATKLDITMRSKRVLEQHDFHAIQWGAWAMVVLDERPVKRVLGIKMQFGSQEVYQIPASWIKVVIPESGQVQIVPNANDHINWPLQQFMFAGNWALSMFDSIPGWFEVEYEAGYDVPYSLTLPANVLGWYPGAEYGFNGRLRVTLEAQAEPDEGEEPEPIEVVVKGTNIAGEATEETLEFTWEGGSQRTTAGWSAIESVTWPESLTGDVNLSGNIPDDTNAGAYSPMAGELLDVAGKLASTYPFNTAGDLIAGAGIATKSTSMDGVSQTIGTTASATNAGYGARLIQYEKEVRKMLPELRRRYHGMSLRMV